VFSFSFSFSFLLLCSYHITRPAVTLFNPSSRPRTALLTTPRIPTATSIPLPAISGGEKGISELLLSSNIASAAEVEKFIRNMEGFVRYEHLHQMTGVLQTDFTG